MRIPSVIHAGFFALCWALVSPNILAQSGSWVLDGWPDERNGYFAGRTEIYADGDRLKIVEWPGAVQQDDEALETYHLGRSVVKVFTWHGERVGLVFESDAPLPKAELNSEGRLVLPAPFPPLPNQESEVPCGEGCHYHVRAVAFQRLDAALFAPGGMLEATFQPSPDVPLMTKEEFLERYHIAPPEWGAMGFGE